MHEPAARAHSAVSAAVGVEEAEETAAQLEVLLPELVVTADQAMQRPALYLNGSELVCHESFREALHDLRAMTGRPARTIKCRRYMVRGRLVVRAWHEINACPRPKIKAENDDQQAFNAQTGEYGDMVAMGVLDPTKVTRYALQNAASVSALILTTDAMVAELPKDEKAPAGMPGGMGGMGDMDM